MLTFLTRMLLFASTAILPAMAGNQVLLRDLNSADGTPAFLTADTAGHIFVFSSLTSSQGQATPRVVELDRNGARITSLDLAQIASATTAKVDGHGNLIVAGRDAAGNGVVVKIDPLLHGAAKLASLPAGIAGIAVDSSDNIYLTGTTSSASLPLTADAYQKTPPGKTGGYGFPGTVYYAFLTKLSTSGGILYSTYFGSDSTVCNGGSSCVGKAATTGAGPIAVDPTGAVLIAGNTTSNGLPVTPGVLKPGCYGGYSFGYPLSVGFVAKFRPGASEQLVWLTCISSSSFSYAGISSMALDRDDNVIVAGTAEHTLPPAPGTAEIPFGSADGAAFLFKMNSTATTALWETYFGESLLTSTVVTLDSQDRVLFIARSGFSSIADIFYGTYIGRLSSDGAHVIDSLMGPLFSHASLGPLDLVAIPDGGFAALIKSGSLWVETAAPGPSILNIADNATNIYASSIIPGELITLYGVGIGPPSPTPGQVRNGVFTSSLGGCQVLFDGIPAPLLYADSGQINAIVPLVNSAHTSRVRVVTPAGAVDGPALSLAVLAAPSVFQDIVSGFAAALNQDGSANSQSNPAKAGSIVSIFTNGVGASSSIGSIPTGVYNAGFAVWVMTSSVNYQLPRSLEVVFAGYTPGAVTGVLQINFRLPAVLTPPAKAFDFMVEISGIPTLASQLFVTP